MESKSYVIHTAKKDEVIHIQKKKVQTVKDLKLEICNSTQIDYDNLRLLRNNKTVKDADSILLSTLDIKDTDKFKAIPFATQEASRMTNKTQIPEKTTVQGKKEGASSGNDKVGFKKVEEKNRSQKKSEQSERTVETKQVSALEKKIKSTGERLVKMGIKEGLKWSKIALGNHNLAMALYSSGREDIPANGLRYFQKTWIKKLINGILSSKSFIENVDKFTGKQGVIEFIFEKLGEFMPGMDIFLEQRKELQEIIGEWLCLETSPASQAEQKTYINGLSDGADPQIVKNIAKLTSSEAEARAIVEMSQNDFNTAVQVAINGQETLRGSRFCTISENELKELQRLTEPEEQRFLLRWLMGQPNYVLRLRLQADQSFLEVYSQSMHHLCKPLFKLLVKQRPFLMKVIKKFPPKLYKSETQ